MSEKTDRDDQTLEDSKTAIPLDVGTVREESAPNPPAEPSAAEPKLDPPTVTVSKPGKSGKSGMPAKSGKSKLLGNLVFVLGFVATLVVGYFVGQWVREKFGDKPQPESGDRYNVELRGDEPQKGPDDALVTIIEFADYQCPYCADSVEPLETAMAAFDGDVRLIFKHYPLPGHGKAAPAAYTSWAAHQQGKFWEFHDRLFEAKASIDEVPAWVEEFQLDADKFGTDMESGAARASVDRDMLAGAKVGVTGTPAFFVNGHLYRGKRDAVQWKQIIAAELDYAEDLVDDGVDRAELYDHLMKDALTKQVGAPERPMKANRKRRPGEPDDTSIYAVPIAGAPVLGPDTALVTIVEFADYHCPYCVKVKSALDEIVAAYPDEVRVVYRQRPLAIHPQAHDASKAALAAHQQGKFWPMHDKLFLRQSKTLDEFKALAGELGMDVDRFVADYESEAVGKALAADLDVAAKFGVTGTPAFFINGRYMSGAQSYGAFEQVVQERIAEAKLMVGQGTAPSKVYETLLSTGKTSSRDDK
ncbi:DsbA family protein [Nannocystaceae bacterium ST9]